MTRSAYSGSPDRLAKCSWFGIVSVTCGGGESEGLRRGSEERRVLHILNFLGVDEPLVSFYRRIRLIVRSLSPESP